MVYQVSPYERTGRAPSPRSVPTLPLGDPTGGANALWWREQVDGQPEFPKVSIDRSLHLTMSDGVRLRATLIRPIDASGQIVEAPMPTVVTINPYNRAVLDLIDQTTHHLPLPPISGGTLDVFGINRKLVQSGYVQLVVDVRGTGASHGRWQILGEREQRDSIEVIDWAADQSWCDGNVGMAGWSYSAINSLQAAGNGSPHLKAVFAVEGCEDIVRDIYITGGAPSAFIPIWLAGVNMLKWLPNPSAALADAFNTNGVRWLKDRVASPATEIGSLAWGFLTGRDPRIYDDPYFDERDPKIDMITAPTFVFGGWHDLFGRSATRIYNQLNLKPGQKQLVMADGYHLDAGRGFGKRIAPPRVDVLERAWFDKWLKGLDNGVDEYGPVTLQQQGGSWTSGESFPRKDARVQRLYLSPASSHTAKHSRHDGSLGAEVNSTAGELKLRADARGFISRDMTQVTAGATMLLGGSFTTKAKFQEVGALSFTTGPMTEAMQISGSMNLHLRTTCGGHEALWAITLNDVAPDGTSTVLTNGSLTASNRSLDPGLCEYAEDGSLLVAHHPLSKKRKLKVTPNSPIDLDIDLVPTDAIIEEGHRLRINIYAASMPRFLAVVPDLIKSGWRSQKVVLDPYHQSYLTFQGM
ncbi:CocE/NonD family hydrolase [Gordonia rubripertincta]|uniref:CocE/NonD family hydrolase n=1 Tax=Gordonia rubripertincta TaxID=36822 RepID=A0ABT4N192_GORRU|nr:CocE/NonD family hydrolase [Gordonia rubripertincta]MCZ4551722.1 CocE/NonD family hydrolase [Gordonia rubripertincta]